MGKERGKVWEYIFLHIACLLAIILLGAGCVTTLKPQKRWQANKRLDLAEKLISKGKYEGALKEYEEILKLFPKFSPGDRALFRLGIIWAHPDNPQRNYKKALEYFLQLFYDFPQSTLREDVRVWLGAINELIRYEGKIEDLEERVNEVIRCEDKIEDLKETVNALKKQLNTLKEIDIGIEKRKRENLPGK